MGAELVFLEGTERDPALEATWREFQPYRDREASVSGQRRLMDTDWGRKRWRKPALRDDAGRVIACMSLFDLAYRLDSRRLRLGGLGAITVREDLRHRGLGRFFLKAVHDRLLAEGFDGAVLFSSIGAEYYARMGYELLPLPTLVVDLRDLGEEPDWAEPSAIRPFEERDLPEVRNLYNTATSLQRLAVLRDDDYWRFEVERAALQVEASPPPPHPIPFLVGERQGRVLSYLRTGRDREHGDLVVHEYGFDPGARQDLTAMLHHLIDALGDDAPRVLRGSVPSRFANIPARRVAWRRQRSNLMMMKSFGGFDVPTELPHDERLVWQADWF